MNKFFKLARVYAIKKDQRNYVFAAIGLRNDGTIVKSRNIPNSSKNPVCHAEYRLSRKLDIDSVVYCVRVSRLNGKLLNARPCRNCERALRQRGVKKVFYSLSEDEYGTLEF